MLRSVARVLPLMRPSSIQQIFPCFVRHYSASSPASTFYSVGEVLRHDSEDDCWLIIDNKVYDVTEYGHEHPGGEIIFKFAGDDATKSFEAAEHSEEAKELLEDFWIGCIKE